MAKTGTRNLIFEFRNQPKKFQSFTAPLENYFITKKTSQIANVWQKLKKCNGIKIIPFWRVGDWFWSNAAVGGKVAFPLDCPKDCLYKLVPFRFGKPPEAGVTVKGCCCWGFEEVNTEVKVVELKKIIEDIIYYWVENI